MGKVRHPMIRHPLTPVPPEIPAEEIRVRAYHLWLAAGRPEGRDWEFWFRARTQLLRRRAAAAFWRRQNVRTTGQDARRYGGAGRLC